MNLYLVKREAKHKIEEHFTSGLQFWALFALYFTTFKSYYLNEQTENINRSILCNLNSTYYTMMTTDDWVLICLKRILDAQVKQSLANHCFKCQTIIQIRILHFQTQMYFICPTLMWCRVFCRKTYGRQRWLMVVFKMHFKPF